MTSYEDPYSLQEIPKKYLVWVGKQPYNMRSLMRAAHHHPTRRGSLPQNRRRLAAPVYLNMYRQPLPKDVILKIQDTLPTKKVKRWETYIAQLAAIVVSSDINQNHIVRIRKLLDRLRSEDSKFYEKGEMTDVYFGHEKSLIASAVYMFVSCDRWGKNPSVQSIFRLKVLKMLLSRKPPYIRPRNLNYLLYLILGEVSDLKKPNFFGKPRHRDHVYWAMYTCIQTLLTELQSGLGWYDVIDKRVFEIINCHPPVVDGKNRILEIMEKFNTNWKIKHSDSGPGFLHQLPKGCTKDVPIPEEVSELVNYLGDDERITLYLPRDRSSLKKSFVEFTNGKSKRDKIQQILRQRKLYRHHLPHHPYAVARDFWDHQKKIPGRIL